MMLVEVSTALALVATLLFLLLGAGRLRRRAPPPPPHTEVRDSLQGCSPEATRVLSGPERRALALLKQAIPGHLVLAQVPLSRFLRVPPAWTPKLGSLCADLVLCDSASRVLAVVDVRAARLSDGGRRRHDRMARLLRAAGIKVLSWPEDELPDAATARRQVLAALTSIPRELSSAPTSRPMPLIPVAEVLAVAEEEADDERAEPVPSALFEDFATDPVPQH